MCVELVVTVEPKPIGPETPTAVETVLGAQTAVKEFRNGVIYIRRGEGVYTTEGKRVK